MVLCILDGVGVARAGRNNAVSRAEMPFFDGLLARYPRMLLNASGTAVGLPPRTIGNSEVGHVTMGAGRIVDQFLRRFQLENLRANRPLNRFIRRTKGAVHVVGLCSDGDVHSDLDDALKVARIILKSGLRIIWHFISDGRDVDPKSALLYVGKIRRALGSGFVFGSICGRYYAMDRNNNWDRTELAFDAIAKRRVKAAGAPIEQVIGRTYRAGVTDEFIKPARLSDFGGIARDDGVLFFNYRADRARQFLKMLVKSRLTRNMLCFSQYGDGLDGYCPALLPDVPIKNTLGDILAKNGLSQLRLAETEKYNHVTYFFDAERMIDYPKEKKILVPSPAVATFDLTPEMSAPGITGQFLKNARDFDAIIMNYANGDMVGHTGNRRAAIAAMETLDKCLARIVPMVLKLDGTILITADHGNAEKMASGLFGTRPWTAHTMNPVPLVAVSNRRIGLKNPRGGAGLANIAPTMLKLLGINRPREMAAPLV
jgi:2,3-bisphosphoglycerate-independent phosphoglycerate mutase